MSNTKDYNAKLETILAIPNEEVKTPSLPVPDALQEAEDLHYWAKDDAVPLKVVGITTEMLNDLLVRAGASREAQSFWNKDFNSQEAAQKEWKVQALQAYALHKDLLQTLRFAYRKDAELLSRVAAITDGSGHADVIQDLNDIAVLGRENADPLTLIGFDLTGLGTAATFADDMANLLAEANGDKAEQSESKLIRDKAYTHLKELVDEIREAGKYVFRNNPDRYKGYISKYWKKKKNKKKGNSTEE